MTLADRLGLTDTDERRLVRLLQGLLVGLTLFGVLTGNPSVAVNAGGSLAVTFIPALLRREVDLHMDVGFVLWLAVAASLHAIGILGPYQTVQWWDYLTHALSATVVAGAGYATVAALDRHVTALHLPEPALSLWVFVFVAAFAVLWELLEVGVTVVSLRFMARSALVVYGVQDMATDLLFTMVGGLLLLTWGRGYARAMTRRVSRTLARS